MVDTDTVMVDTATVMAVTATGYGEHGHGHGGHGHGHGGHFWHGHWWGYGEGPCWRLTPAGYVWICE
jgi:hypothetical protein